MSTTTVTTTAPNFVRGTVIPMTLGYQYLSIKTDPVYAAAIVGVVVFGLTLMAFYQLNDTFGKDLDYTE